MRFHLFPFRTEKLSSLAPMVLRFSRGRVGSRLFKPNSISGFGFFFCIIFNYYISAKPWCRVWLEGRQTCSSSKNEVLSVASGLNTLEQRTIVQTESRVHFVVCTLPRCSQSKRHIGAVGSCRKLSLATDKYFAAIVCVTYPPPFDLWSSSFAPRQSLQAPSALGLSSVL